MINFTNINQSPTSVKVDLQIDEDGDACLELNDALIAYLDSKTGKIVFMTGVDEEVPSLVEAGIQFNSDGSIMIHEEETDPRTW